MNILLISPPTPNTFWGFKHVMPFIGKKAAFPPLGLLTVAAMLPRDWELSCIDMNVSALRDEAIDRADYVFVSAMVIQEEGVWDVLARCQRLGTPLVAGGPLFTTGYERFTEIDHVVLGEVETLMPTIIEDMVAGEMKHLYECDEKPDISMTPSPRWDLISLHDYATMSVQFSRGCPFDCEFCDIVAMYGRVPRVKSPAQLIAELDDLVDRGWNDTVFIVDDNFIGHKRKAAELLRELIAWRRRRRVNVDFLTEVSLNIVDMPDLLELMVEAGFKKVFVGIETPEEVGLAECSKVQNAGRDLPGAVRTLQNAGLDVMAGFIVGFDSDERSIFERQERFIQEAGVVTAMVGLLTALPKTRLFARLMSEGRILKPSTGNNVDATLNFIPRLDRDVLIEGYRTLVKHLYAPKAYYRRALTFLREYQPRGPKIPMTWTNVWAFLRSLWVMGVWTKGRREYWKYLTKVFVFHRRNFAEAISIAIKGYHLRRVAAGL